MTSADPFRQQSAGSMSSPTTERTFETRQIRHFDRLCFIVLQDANGPCPLISVFNVLSLRGHVALRLTGSTRVTLQRIVHAIGNYILERSRFEQEAFANHSAARHQEYANNDAFEALPTMYEGLDVNPRFRHIEDFEPTASLSLFECVRIRLVHGWLVDPVNEVTENESINSRSYNQLVTEAVSDQGKWSKSPAKSWLTRHSTQLTPFGLDRLFHGMAEQELAILFRNNHFHVITRQVGTLYTLVTDEVLARQAPSPVWQSLVSVSEAASTFIGPFVPQYIPQPGSASNGPYTVSTPTYYSAATAGTAANARGAQPAPARKARRKDRGETCACCVQ